MTHSATLIIFLGFALTTAHSLSGYFWHVTDFHMDVNYSTTGDVNNMCWNTLEDGEQPDGMFGDYRCDSPYQLVLSAVSAMKKLHPNPDFILWTGDDKAHVSDNNFSPDIVFSLIENLTNTIMAEFPNVPLAPVLGNHDWYPTHQLPSSEAELYLRIGELWKDYIGKGNETFYRGGFYTTILPNQVRFVVLNTALYYKKNKILDNAKNSKDPGGQLEWLEKTLTDARKNKEKVYISSHVPFGVFERHFKANGFQWINPKFNKRLIELIAEFGDIILGQFFAHHHTDSFRVLYDKNGRPSSWMLIAPAVTPWNTTLTQVGPNNPALRLVQYNDNAEVRTSRNPAVRLLTYNTETGEITDVLQYYLNLTEKNLDSNAEWKLEYSFKDAYNVSPLTAESMSNLAENFLNNRTVFDRYYLYNSVSYQSPSVCDSYCRYYHYCAITNVDFDKFEACRSSSSKLGNGVISIILMVVVGVITWQGQFKHWFC